MIAFTFSFTMPSIQYCLVTNCKKAARHGSSNLGELQGFRTAFSLILRAQFSTAFCAYQLKPGSYPRYFTRYKMKGLHEPSVHKWCPGVDPADLFCVLVQLAVYLNLSLLW